MTRPLDRVAVVGTGLLGSQIALLAVHAGYEVKVFDPREGSLAEALAKVRADIQASGVRPFIEWDRWAACQEALRPAADLEAAVKEAELIVEAVPEDLDLKRQVWQELGRKSPPAAILATNSSSIPVSRLEESGGRPERSLNIHFYFPLQRVNMVDLMGGTRTLSEVLETGRAWIESLGCVPLRVNKELLGFCFNRVWRVVKKETLSLWANGFVDFRDVDRGWMIFTGMKTGPFGLMDRVGLDVVYDIEMVYYRESGDPGDHPPQALKDKIERGELGVKSGQGFYQYPDPEYLAPDFLAPGGASGGPSG